MSNILREWNLGNKGEVESIRYNDSRMEFYCTNGDFVVYADEDCTGETSIVLNPNEVGEQIAGLNKIKLIKPKQIINLDFSTLEANFIFNEGYIRFSLEQKSFNEDIEHSLSLENLKTKIEIQL